MSFAKLITIIGIVAMGIALVYGFSADTLNQDGAALVRMPWGIVSLVDVYTGFVLFSGWILYREKSIWLALTWVVVIMVGNFITSAYAFLALIQSRGDWKKFWLGARV